MLKLSKKAEYAILSMQYLAENCGDKLNAKEIALSLGLSFEFLSKTMQSLMKSGLVSSVQGVKGGYVLSKPANLISLMEVINATDEKIGIVDCLNANELDCNRNDNCSIKNPMYKIQKLIDGIFVNTTIADLVNDNDNKATKNGYSKNLIELRNFI